jgi:hypothetical protein
MRCAPVTLSSTITTTHSPNRTEDARLAAGRPRHDRDVPDRRDAVGLSSAIVPVFSVTCAGDSMVSSTRSAIVVAPAGE